VEPKKFGAQGRIGMTGFGKNEITAAIEADPKLQERMIRMIMDPELGEMVDACDSSPEMRLVAKTLSTSIELQKHVAALVGITRSEDVALRRLDAAEEQIIDATRKVKHATLETWAQNQVDRVEARVKAERTKGLHKDQKKSSIS